MANSVVPFKKFIRMKHFFPENGYRKVEETGNNFLVLRKDLNVNVNDSGVENLGTDWMLKRMGEGNFKFTRRWAWLYRHYIWASKVTKPRAHVVDIGCDVGEIRNIISKSFYVANPYYVGIDMDHKRLQSGANHIQMKIPAMYIQHDVTTGLEFIKSKSVDNVFAGEIIEHFEKKFGGKLLKEIRRILVPGGKFIISTPNKKYTKGYEFHVHEYGVKELKNLVVKCGLKIEKSWGWTTTERVLKEEMSSKELKVYEIFKKKIHKDLVVPMFSYLNPEYSEAFCIEGIRPIK
jgi:SAM-dependent methyltransferase